MTGGPESFPEPPNPSWTPPLHPLPLAAAELAPPAPSTQFGDIDLFGPEQRFGHNPRGYGIMPAAIDGDRLAGPARAIVSLMQFFELVHGVSRRRRQYWHGPPFGRRGHGFGAPAVHDRR